MTNPPFGADPLFRSLVGGQGSQCETIQPYSRDLGSKTSRQPAKEPGCWGWGDRSSQVSLRTAETEDNDSPDPCGPRSSHSAADCQQNGSPKGALSRSAHSTALPPQTVTDRPGLSQKRACLNLDQAGAGV
jgi:hypothetical protein